MKTEKLLIHTPMIHLNQMLKLSGIAENGGEANDLITSGQVMVNGVVELRKRKQLLHGDVVECMGGVFMIQPDLA